MSQKKKQPENKPVTFVTGPRENEIRFEEKKKGPSKKEKRQMARLRRQNERILNQDNGISLTYLENSPLTENAAIKFPFIEPVLRTLLAMLAALSAVMTLTSILNIPVLALPIVFCVVATAAVSAVGFIKLKKLVWIVPVAAVVLIAAVFGITYNSFLTGTTFSVDFARASIYESMRWGEITPTYEWTDEFLSATTLVLSSLSVLLTCAITYFTVRRVHFIAVFLLTFPCFEIGAAFGCVPNYYWFGLMVASWAAALTLSRSRMKIKVRGRKKKSSTAGAEGRFAGSAAFIAVLTFLVFVGAQWLITASGFTRGEDLANLRTNIQDSAENLVDYITGNDRDGSLKEGQLCEMGKLVYKNRKYMNMNTPQEKIKEPIYLRGYTATVYTGHSWTQYGDYEQTDLFDELNKNNFSPIGVNGYLLSNHRDIAGFGGYETVLSQFRRKKDYAFTTYNANFNASFTANYDISLKPANSSKYTYTSYPTVEYYFKLPEIDLFQSEKFKPYWDKYSAFVKENYTQLPDNLEAVTQLVTDMKEPNRYRLIDKIRTYFEKNTKYSLQVSKYHEQEEFVTSFLFEKKRGYSAHYATAAAVMLRAAGVPTRYVEGYFIPTGGYNKERVENANGTYDYTVTDKNAHAWIEIYSDDFGWIPVEVTPGFYHESFYDYMNSHTKAPNNNQTTTEKPEDGIAKDPNNLVQNFDPHRQPDVKVKPGETTDNTSYVTVGSIAFVLLLAIILYVAVHVTVVRRRRKALTAGPARARILAGFSYLLWLFDFTVKKQPASYQEWPRLLCALLPDTPPDAAQELIDIFLSCGFSEHEPLEQQAEFVSRFVLEYAKQFYAQLNRLTRIRVRWILHRKIS